MVKKTITYTDYNGVERTEEFLFNLSKAELLEMELSINGGLSEMLNKLVATNDIAEIVKIFKSILIKSYGVKSIDGKHFIKSEELSTAFIQTEAYSQLFMELTTDSQQAAAFVNGLLTISAAKIGNNIANQNLLSPA